MESVVRNGSSHTATAALPPLVAGSESGTESLLAEFLTMTRSERTSRFADTFTVSRSCGVSQRTIGHWIEAGKIEAVRIGHKYFVDLTSLRLFLRAAQDP